MKKIRITLGICVAALIVGSCSENEIVPVQPTDPTQVEFSGAVPLSLPDGTEYLADKATVRVLAYKRTGSSANLASDIFKGQQTYVSDGAGKLTSCNVNTNGTFLSTSTDALKLGPGKYDFYAVTPALQVANLPAVEQPNTSIPTVAVGHGVDYAVTYLSEKSVSGTTQIVDLPVFQRQCAKITWEIDQKAGLSPAITSIEMVSLSLSGMTTATITTDINSNELTLPGTYTDKLEIKAAGFTRENTKSTASAIVLPCENTTGDVEMYVKIDGGSAVYLKSKLSATPFSFEPGKAYTVSIKLTGAYMTVSYTVKDWTVVHWGNEGDSEIVGAPTSP